jgi:hypothetical protein
MQARQRELARFLGDLGRDRSPTETGAGFRDLSRRGLSRRAPGDGCSSRLG